MPMRSSETRPTEFANWTVVTIAALALLIATTGCKSKPEPLDEEEPTLEVEPDRHSTNWRSRPIERRDGASSSATTTDSTSASSSARGGAASASAGGSRGGGGAGGGSGGSSGGGGGGNPLLEISSTPRPAAQARDDARATDAGSTVTATESAADADDADEVGTSDVVEVTGGDATASARDTWSDLLQVSDELVDALLPAPPPEIEASLAVLDSLTLPDGDRRRDFIGVWVQTGGANTPDFFVGGQRATLLVFRTDGLCDVIRTFDDASTVRVARRFDYLVEADGTVVLGSDPKRRPTLDRRERNVPLPGGGTATVRPPAQPLPVRLESKVEGVELTLDGRRYRRVNRTRGDVTGS